MFKNIDIARDAISEKYLGKYGIYHVDIDYGSLSICIYVDNHENLAESITKDISNDVEIYGLIVVAEPRMKLIRGGI